MWQQWDFAVQNAMDIDSRVYHHLQHIWPFLAAGSDLNQLWALHASNSCWDIKLSKNIQISKNVMFIYSITIRVKTKVASITILHAYRMTSWWIKNWLFTFCFKEEVHQTTTMQIFIRWCCDYPVDLFVSLLISLPGEPVSSGLSKTDHTLGCGFTYCNKREPQSVWTWQLMVDAGEQPRPSHPAT